MKKLIFLALFFAAVSVLGFVPPKGGEKSALLGGKTEWVYHAFGDKEFLEWEITGTGYYRLFLRSTDIKGEFTLYLDGDKYKSDKFSEGVSDKYKMRRGDGKPIKITSAETMKIRIGRGKHILKVVGEGEMFARLARLPGKSTSIAPDEYDKSLALITGDTRTTYYSATEESPAVLNVEGPAKIEVWTRLAFDKSMRGNQHYTIEVTGADKALRMKLESEISETSSFENDGDVIPGRAEKFDIKLKKGKYKLTFRPADTGAPYCAMRFTIRR